MKAYRLRCLPQLGEWATTSTSPIILRRLSSDLTAIKKSTFLESLPKVFVDLTRSESERQMKKHKTRSEILIDCFQIYKSMNGDEQVPPSFVIPMENDVWPEEAWGLKLGTAAEITRKGKNTFKYMHDELIDIGFVFASRRVTNSYLQFKSGLLQYQALHGDMLVPATFMIPHQSTEWREELWGLKLGAAVNGTRGGRFYKGKRAELVAAGFNYNPQSISYGYDLVRAALIRYKKLNGDMLVPGSFVIPEQSDVWPEHMGGMRLGRCASSIRAVTCFKEKREELESLGFDFSNQSVAHGFNLIYMALCHYKALNGHVLVQSSFIVPDKSIEWPEITWGLRLGMAVTNVRSRNMYKSNRDELLKIGFDFNPQKKVYGLKLVKEALIRFKELHGHLKVPYFYVITVKNEDYHPSLWGMNLGGAVKAIRNGTRYTKNKEELENIGLHIPDVDRYISVKLAMKAHQKNLEQKDKKDRELNDMMKKNGIIGKLAKMEIIGNDGAPNCEEKEIKSVVVSPPLKYYKVQRYD